MQDLHPIQANPTDQHHFLARDNYYKPFKKLPTSAALRKLDLHALPAEIKQYVSYLCTLYKNPKRAVAPSNTQLAVAKKSTLSLALKKICEVYAIGLLVCDSLTARITYLEQQAQTKKLKIPTLSHQHAYRYANAIAAILQRIFTHTSATFANFSTSHLTTAELTQLNNYAKLIINIYNSSELGIFRKQPVRHFNATTTAMHE